MKVPHYDWPEAGIGDLGYEPMPLVFQSGAGRVAAGPGDDFHDLGV